MQGIVFNIQRFSVNDGPGIRTTVFLKGCPLNCWWCQNPEGINFGHEIINSKETGKLMEADELFEEIIKDRIFYEESGGGVTFSGGEPLAQPEFLESVLKKCIDKGIHTAVDTSGYADKAVIEKIRTVTNLFLFDLKLIDQEEHLKYTGKPNDLILNNLEFLVDRKASVIVRIPLIPMVTAAFQNLSGIMRFLKQFDQKIPVHLLNYHQMAEAKYQRLGINYRMKGYEKATGVEIQNIRKLFLNSGFEVNMNS